MAGFVVINHPVFINNFQDYLTQDLFAPYLFMQRLAVVSTIDLLWYKMVFQLTGGFPIKEARTEGADIKFDLYQ